MNDIAEHFKFYDARPVISLIGAHSETKGKILGGLTRAATNCKAVIIDSAVSSGLEKHCLRRELDLIGIAPEGAISYPKITPKKAFEKVITNGHTHLILLKDKKTWGDELKFKMNFCERLISGRKGSLYRSKGIGIIFGNIPNIEEEIKTVNP